MELALFPLHTVLFPGTALPLHVFEARYRMMMSHVLATDRTLGIIAIARGVEAGGRAQVHEVGCAATVEDVRTADDGTMDIIVAGRSRFRIVERLPDDPYPVAEVELLSDRTTGAGYPEVAAARAAVVRHLEALGTLHGEKLAPPALPGDVLGSSFALAAALQTDLPHRQRLLACDDAAERLRLVEETGRREALLLSRVGPSVGHPRGGYSPN